MAVRMATIATVIMSSISVKPSTAHRMTRVTRVASGKGVLMSMSPVGAISCGDYAH